MSNTAKPTPLTSQEKELFDLLHKRDVPALRNFFERGVSKFFFDINCHYLRHHTNASYASRITSTGRIYRRHGTLLHHGLTPLMIVTWMQGFDENSQMEMMTMLLENGADINKQITIDNKNFLTGNVNYVLGMTALHLACLRRSCNLTKLLLHHGPNPNIVDDSGESPLFYAIKCQRCPSDVIKELLHHGASPHISDAGFRTPLHYACQFQRFDVIKIILEYGGVDVNMQDNWGRTPLHDLCLSNYAADLIPFIQLLLTYGANINIPDTYGATALMNSFLLEEKPISEQKLGMIRCILNAEADVMNAMTDDTNVHGVPMVVGDTPLHVAVKKGNAPLVRLLMEFYPTLTKRNRHYETALDVGRNMGETLIVCMLESEQRQRFYKNLVRYWIKQQYHPKTVFDTTRGNPTS